MCVFSYDNTNNENRECTLLWKNYISLHAARGSCTIPVSCAVFKTEWITLWRFVFNFKPRYLKYQWRRTTASVLCTTLRINTTPFHPTIPRQRKDVPRSVGMTNIRASHLLLPVALPSLPLFSVERRALDGRDDEKSGLPLPPLVSYLHHNAWRYNMTTEKSPTGPQPTLFHTVLTPTPPPCFPWFPLRSRNYVFTNTVIPRLTKIIRSEITFVSRNFSLSRT